MKITKAPLLFFSLSLSLLSGSLLAEEALTRGIIFTNPNVNAAPIAPSSFDDLNEWGADFIENNTSPKTNGGNNCHSSRSIVLFGNNTIGSAIAHSQTQINQCSN